MKNRVLSFNEQLIQYGIDGKIISESSVGNFYFSLTASPNPNPGNHLDPTNFSYDKFSSTLFTGSRDLFYYGEKYATQIGPYGAGSVLLIPSWDRSRMYSRALSKLNSKEGGANWSEDLAEAGKTAKTAGLIGAARDLGNVLNRRKAGIEGALKSAVGFLSAGTLLTQFGLKPLVQNVFDTADVLLQNAVNDGYIAYGSSTEPINIDVRLTNPNSGSTIPNSVQHATSGKQGCRIKVWVKPDPNKSPTLDDFSTLNPYLLAWNLMPYSFLVDWAYNVSGYLEAMEMAFKRATRFDKGYYTELYAIESRETISGYWNQSSNGWAFVKHGVATRKHTQFSRTVLHNWPLPNLPSLEVDLGSGQMLSAAALLGNLLNSPSKSKRKIPLGIYGKLGK